MVEGLAATQDGCEVRHSSLGFSLRRSFSVCGDESVTEEDHQSVTEPLDNDREKERLRYDKKNVV